MSWLRKYILPSLILLAGCDLNGPLNPSENITNIPVIDVSIEHEDYLALKENRTLNLDVPCIIKYKGKRYPAEIRASGAGSRYYHKWSYRIELGDNEIIEGINEFNLSAQVEDPSMIRTLVTGKLYEQAGFLSFKNFHTFLRINDKDEGLYCLIEIINEKYFQKHDLPVDELFKLGFASAFSFSSPNYPEFHFSKQIPDDDRYYSLIQFINAVDTSDSANLESGLGGFLNLDSYLKYHALTSIMGNVDAFTNNYFLYKRYPDSPFEIIPWDFDKSYYLNGELGLVGENDIIKRIFQNFELFSRYKAIMLDQLNNLIDIDVINSLIDSTAAEIEYSYNIDNYLGASGLNFSQEVENFKTAVSARKDYLLENIDTLQQNYFNR